MRRFYLAYFGRVIPIAQTTSGRFKKQAIGQTASGQANAIAQTVSGQSAEREALFALSCRTNIHAREYELYLPSKKELQIKLTEWVGGGHE